MNRKELMPRRKIKSNKSPNLVALTVLNPNAAGIEVGAKVHCVAVLSDRDPEPVRSFEALLRSCMSWRAGVSISLTRGCRVAAIAQD
jgi:hypothetical protein